MNLNNGDMMHTAMHAESHHSIKIRAPSMHWNIRETCHHYWDTYADSWYLCGHRKKIPQCI